jgi:hypothetical protein
VFICKFLTAAPAAVGLWQVPPLRHAVAKIERASVDCETAIAKVIQRAAFHLGFIDPDSFRLEDEEVVGVDKARVGDLALDISKAVAK